MLSKGISPCPTYTLRFQVKKSIKKAPPKAQTSFSGISANRFNPRSYRERCLRFRSRFEPIPLKDLPHLPRLELFSECGAFVALLAMSAQHERSDRPCVGQGVAPCKAKRTGLDDSFVVTHSVPLAWREFVTIVLGVSLTPQTPRLSEYLSRVTG